MNDADEDVKRLVLHYLRSQDHGWRDGYEAPEPHFTTCPDVTVTEVYSSLEMWFDTGVEATRLEAILQCPHREPIEWEWADLGELPDLLRDLDDLRAPSENPVYDEAPP